MRWVALAVMLASGSASAADPVEIHDVALLSVAVTLIGVDCLQSMDIKRIPPPSWNPLLRYGAEETNPLVTMLFGKHPTDAQFIGLGVATAGALTGLWYFSPEKVRWVLPSLVILVEGANVYASHQAGFRIRF